MRNCASGIRSYDRCMDSGQPLRGLPSNRVVWPASSNPERALVGEKRRRAAGVQEDDILVVAPAPLADQGDQARKALARIDGIEWKRLELACKADRFDGGLVRDAVGRARMARDDFHACLVERDIKQVGRFAR